MSYFPHSRLKAEQAKQAVAIFYFFKEKKQKDFHYTRAKRTGEAIGARAFINNEIGKQALRLSVFASKIDRNKKQE
jgi:hypothetical protein